LPRLLIGEIARCTVPICAVRQNADQPGAGRARARAGPAAPGPGVRAAARAGL